MELRKLRLRVMAIINGAPTKAITTLIGTSNGITIQRAKVSPAKARMTPESHENQAWRPKWLGITVRAKLAARKPANMIGPAKAMAAAVIVAVEAAADALCG